MGSSMATRYTTTDPPAFSTGLSSDDAKRIAGIVATLYIDNVRYQYTLTDADYVDIT